MDGKRLSVTGPGAAIRRLTLATGIGGLALLGTGATATTAAPAVAQALHLAPMHLIGPTHGHGSGGGGAASASSTVCWASSNWSGYALSGTASGLSCVPSTGVTYTSVTATWTVPRVTGSSRGSTYSAVWTGIDGFTNSKLIQAGTEEDVVNGVAHYNSWWEILPAAETPITTVPVSPGDKITVSIAKGVGSSWTITLTDLTTSKSFATVQSYSGPGSSAEWIVEAPTVGGRIASMANYGTTAFDDATANGSGPALQAGTAGETIQKSGFRSSIVSSPSAPDRAGANSTTDPAGDGFASAYGSSSPAQPAG